jgi:P-type E1-E2 ATPase
LQRAQIGARGRIGDAAVRAPRHEHAYVAPAVGGEDESLGEGLVRNEAGRDHPQTLPRRVDGREQGGVSGSSHTSAPDGTIWMTALLASIPAALPATFTLSAALGAQALARRRVLLTRLSAAHEAAGMDILCADKTGTLTRNRLEVADVAAMPGFDRERVLALARLASSEADLDPIDAAIRAAATTGASERLVRFVPFDPATKKAEAFAVDGDGKTLRIVKGVFEVVSRLAEAPAEARQQMGALAGLGNRVIAVAMGAPEALRLAGLVAIGDTPREDSAELIATLREMGGCAPSWSAATPW